MKHIFILFGSIVLLLLNACQFKVNEGIEWDADLLAPIAHSTVNIDDVVQDSTLLTVNPDNTLSIVYRDTLASARLADLVEIPDTTVREVITLDSLDLSPNAITQQVTLGFLARQLSAQGNPIGDLILNSQGGTMPAVPATPGITSGVIPIDASNFFEFADLSEGELDLTIKNELPLDLENVKVRISNQNLQNIIVQDSFALIPSSAQVSKTYDLSGKRIESALEGELVNLDIAGGVAIPIDTNDYVEIILEARNLKAYEATAIFPQQTLIDTIKASRYKFPPEYADVELTKVGIKSGELRAEMLSTIEDTIFFAYDLVSATKDGQIPGVAVKLDPAPLNGSSSQTQTFDLSGFVLDLTNGGKPGVFNTYQERQQVDLLYSGNVVNISVEDSVVMLFGLLDIVPDYVEGYLGREEIRFTGKAVLELFEDLDVNKIHFSRPKADIKFSNSIGVDNSIVMRTLQGRDPAGGASVQLSGSPILAGPVSIPGPDLPDTSTSIITSLGFTPQNSNIDDFINLLPSEVEYDIEIQTNYNGTPGVYDNFATDNSEINALIDIEIPLDGIVDQLVLTDTSELDFGDAQIDDINGGLLRVIVDNQYPFEAQMWSFILDENMQVIDTLAENFILSAGMPDDNGYVENPVRSTLEKVFDRELLNEVIDRGQHISFRYSLSTRPDETAVQVFYDYVISARIVGQFNYSINQ